MSIQSNFPAIKPTLLLDFANTEALDPRITFARASTATYYNGVTTAKAEENLLLQSQDFTTTWIADNASVTANSDAAPDGTTTAEKLIPANASDLTIIGNGAVRQAPSFASDSTFTFSVFAKADGFNRVELYFSEATGTANRASVTYSLVDGTVVTAAAVAGTFTSVSSTSTSVGNSWYRLTLTFTAGTATTARARIAARDSVTSTGDGTSGILIWGAQLEQRSAVTAYTPTTTQPITNYVPVLLSAANNVPRFDHNPVTGESLGLLIEEQRTNLVTYSEQFDNASWGKTRSSITANTIVAPDGTLTADKLVENTDTNTHLVRQDLISITSGVTYTYSVYVKAAERNFVFLRMNNSASSVFGTTPGSRLNLTTGEVAAGSTVLTTTATSVGDGWWRFAITATATTTGTTNPSIYLATSLAGGGESYTGNGFDGIYIWGAQLEVGAFPTSYIPTVASQVTRAADVASMTGSNFSSWYNAAEGTIYGDALFGDLTNGRLIAGIYGTTNANRLTIGLAATLYGAASVVENEIQANLGSGAKTSNSKIAFAYKVDDFAVSGNGSAVATDNSGTVPVADKIFIGSRIDGNISGFANGHIRKIAYYPLRLSNTNLVALTS